MREKSHTKVRPFPTSKLTHRDATTGYSTADRFVETHTIKSFNTLSISKFKRACIYIYIYTHVCFHIENINDGNLRKVDEGISRGSRESRSDW